MNVLVSVSSGIAGSIALWYVGLVLVTLSSIIISGVDMLRVFLFPIALILVVGVALKSKGFQAMGNTLIVAGLTLSLVFPVIFL